MSVKLMVLTALMLTAALTPLAALAADDSDKIAAEKAVPVMKPMAYFENLRDGDTVSSPFTVKFGVSGMEIAPAGTETAGTGHFHLLIDTELSAEEQKFAIPTDDKHLHFGKGQKETEVTLPAGQHTLQIVMGDGAHMLHTPPVMSDKITVTVK
jgi:hypothetical protein